MAQKIRPDLRLRNSQQRVGHQALAAARHATQHAGLQLMPEVAEHRHRMGSGRFAAENFKENLKFLIRKSGNFFLGPYSRRALFIPPPLRSSASLSLRRSLARFRPSSGR